MSAATSASTPERDPLPVRFLSIQDDYEQILTSAAQIIALTPNKSRRNQHDPLMQFLVLATRERANLGKYIEELKLQTRFDLQPWLMPWEGRGFEDCQAVNDATREMFLAVNARYPVDLLKALAYNDDILRRDGKRTNAKTPRDTDNIVIVPLATNRCTVQWRVEPSTLDSGSGAHLMVLSEVEQRPEWRYVDPVLDIACHGPYSGPVAGRFYVRCINREFATALGLHYEGTGQALIDHTVTPQDLEKLFAYLSGETDNK